MSDDPTAPQPLDAETLDAIDAEVGHCRVLGEFGPDMVLVSQLTGTIRSLRAEVDRLTANLATTTSLLHKLFDRYDLGTDGEPAERYEARAAQS